ncbi:type II secretion system minor pseudopilin GspH [Klebsiella michiganensis]|uniref:type II secretion system minor pseudopilin GspH n=1 Tax=Klebsiella michiganensis TaxID=1134687 RepID=UPI00177D07F7|nr:type II secretion system minor pseudopilin GspH [Klebsiella michiganensis]ELI8805651.1 type II secretion system minor pseudopilin GspH [Klebsiella michiganensis]MBE0155190.1 type II secretion system protein GspH [Klebsiella michiganensis]MBE0167173.1 type II secretion system protein GspH [Klebsiella michiganensis]MBE0191393.1 type II secretion system protein GspH [Klebsiella michiganensis]MBE0219994.1 type II secretion system protein GspH [Klebsiella michiganensis]
MRQRGFTLLEMMLILLLIGVSAGMVMLAFSASRDDSAAQALARFEAQLRFVQQRGLQTGQFFGASVHPDRWQFLVLQPRESNDPPPAGDDWNGYRWLPLRAGRVATSGSVAGNTLHLTFPQGEAWTPGDNPDVLIFPGGEMTPFRLTVGEGPGIAFNARGESLPEPQETP